MAKRRKAPELTFQQHIADFLVREHCYGVLEQSDITDTEHFIAEDQLWAFLQPRRPTRSRSSATTTARTGGRTVFQGPPQGTGAHPLWMLLRHGLQVRGLEFRLYYPKPRSAESAAAKKYGENRITFRPHFYFGATNEEIDFVFFLNGLPIVALELNTRRTRTYMTPWRSSPPATIPRKIFQHPFLYLAADTSDVMAATDPRREENFRWHNTGLTNTPQNPNEYPVEFLYREVLSKEHLLEALSFFLSACPKREAEATGRAAGVHHVPALSSKPHGAEDRRHLGALCRPGATSARNTSPTIPPAAARRSRFAGWRTGSTACTSPARTRSWWTWCSSSRTANRSTRTSRTTSRTSRT